MKSPFYDPNSSGGIKRQYLRVAINMFTDDKYDVGSKVEHQIKLRIEFALEEIVLAVENEDSDFIEKSEQSLIKIINAIKLAKREDNNIHNGNKVTLEHYNTAEEKFWCTVQPYCSSEST